MIVCENKRDIGVEEDNKDRVKRTVEIKREGKQEKEIEEDE